MSDRPSLADRAVSVLANIETLEAEKAERDAQEPAAWVLFDDIFIAPKDMQDDPPNLEANWLFRNYELKRARSVEEAIDKAMG